MTRNSLVIAISAVALVLALGALAVQLLVPAKGDGVSRADFDALRNQVSTLKSGGAGLKVAFVNADSAFTIFTNAVSDLRQRATDKRQQVTDLQNSYMQGTVSKDQYQKRLYELNVEVLDAQLSVDVGTLDRMIASSNFADLRADLQRLREQSQSIVDEVKNLVSMAKGGAIDATEFQNRFTQAQNAFTQLDQLVTQAATAKMQQAAQKVAIQRGFDLVIPAKNVVVYFNPATVTDITEYVKTEIANYL